MGNTCSICWQPTDDETDTICATCARQLSHDLKWLRDNAPTLEGHRLNRANHSGGRTGSPTRTASSTEPIRDGVFDLLYMRDRFGNPGIRITLTGYAACLNIPYGPNTPIADIAARILSAHTTASTATPVYAREIHALTAKARRMLEPDRPAVIIGPCPLDSCGTVLTAAEDATLVKCPACGNSWDPAFVRAARARRLLASEKTGTQPQIGRMLSAMGVDINRSTLRSWIHRGQLEPHGSIDGKPAYRLADVYRLALDKETR